MYCCCRYELMCAPPSASVEDLKHAFREFALRHHPDKAPQGTGAMYARARVSLKLKALSYSCVEIEGSVLFLR